MTALRHDPLRDAALPPALEQLLARVGARLRRLVWMHGLGTLLAVASGVLVFAFLADWTLHLPEPIRWVHLGLLVALPAYFFVRELWRPLRRVPNRAGLAVLVERAHPELDQVLVSAVELNESTQPSGARERIEAVTAEADRAARELALERVLDARGPRLRFLSGALAASLGALLFVTNAGAASIFFQRLAGGDVPWPQRTHLSIEIPMAAELQPQPSELSAPALVSVRVARGSDVPVLVRAEGLVPDEVVLHFEQGEEIVLGKSGGDSFRTLLRSVQEDLEFWATGGDDDDDKPRVRLQVLQPPDVKGLAVTIRPPAYSGLAARTERDRDVEVLAGSVLEIHVLPEPAEAGGVVRLLPDDRVLELERRPFPLETSTTAPAGTDANPVATTAEGLGFDLTPQQSLRYRFELKDRSGLTNPDPGLYGVQVVEDRAPEVEVLAPGRGDVDTVLTGRIALRARAQDDFGLSRVTWSARLAADDALPGKEEDVEWTRIGATSETKITPGAAAADTKTASARFVAVARRSLDVKELGRGEPVVEGQQFLLSITATDNRQPNPGVGASAPVRVRVVSTDEFMRRLQDRLAHAQTTTASLAELQREKARATRDLLGALETDELLREGASAEINQLLTGQRRAQGDARALARELASLCESVLYARLEERSGAALDILDARLALSLDRAFDPAPWRELAATQAQGTFGPPGFAGKLIEITGIALQISEDHGIQAANALSSAQDTVDVGKVHAALVAASGEQQKALEKLDRLLGLLAEWDNFQSVLSLTRDILNGQKTLIERTRQHAKEH